MQTNRDLTQPDTPSELLENIEELPDTPAHCPKCGLLKLGHPMCTCDVVDTPYTDELTKKLKAIFSANFNDGDDIEERRESSDMYCTEVILDFIEEFVVSFITAHTNQILDEIMAGKRLLIEEPDEDNVMGTIEAVPLTHIQAIKDRSK